jgi:hypothetical protein
MTPTTENRVRAAMDAIADQVETAPPPPLTLPPPATAARHQGERTPRRRWGPWLAPAAAAAAVIAVAVTLVAVRNAPAGRPATPPPAASASGAPEYYVALPPVPQLGFFDTARDAVVGDTFTGKRVATVPAPAGWGFAGVTAAGDDRTFVLSVEPSSNHMPVPTRWYVLRLTPGAARPATLRQLPIPTESLDGGAFSMALSPDGSMLAIASSPDDSVPAMFATGQSVTELRVYSTATGALLHTWSAASSQSHGIAAWNPIFWTSGGHQLAFQTESSTGQVVVRLLPADDPGHDLLADSRPVLSFIAMVSSPHNCVDGFLVAGNGKTVVCGSTAQVREPASDTGGNACPTSTHLYNPAILQFSTVTGKLTGTLYQIGIACRMLGDPALYWANDAGTAVLGYVSYYEETKPGGQSTPLRAIGQFGLFTRGKFTPLPAPLESDQGYPSSTAW